MSIELERLQGDWKIVELEMEGQNMPAMDARISIHGDRFTTSGMGAEYTGRVEVDSSKEPKHINLIFENGPEKGNTSVGIFEILDDQTWKICLTTQGANRPQRFATAPGTGHACEMLKRLS
jgi:uncharacterized protein (TIGR03067 family)